MTAQIVGHFSRIPVLDPSAVGCDADYRNYMRGGLDAVPGQLWERLAER